MAIEHHTWRWEGFSFRDFESFVPVFGKWCGPGWSAGKRQASFDQHDLDSGAAENPTTKKDSPIDAICVDHDDDYQRAEGLPDEANRKLAADIVLLERLARLDKSRLTREEIQYCFAMEYLFNLMTILPRMILPEESYTQKTPLDEETKKQIEETIQALFKESAKKINELTKIAKQASNKVFESSFPEMKKEMEAKLAAFIKDIEQKKKNHSQAKTKIPESSSQKPSGHRKTENSANVLGDILTPEKLFNGDGKFSDKTFASIQQQDFAQESIDAVLHAQHTYQYNPDDFDFLFKNKAVVYDKNSEPSDQETSDDYTVRARSRDYA